MEQVIKEQVQERHPREQGLKHALKEVVEIYNEKVQERHPREQGLKPQLPERDVGTGYRSRATSTRTRIETRDHAGRS
mgnify:CR=1 FL=1